MFKEKLKNQGLKVFSGLHLNHFRLPEWPHVFLIENLGCILFLISSHVKINVGVSTLQQPPKGNSLWICSVSPLSSTHCVCQACIFIHQRI